MRRPVITAVVAVAVVSALLTPGAAAASTHLRYPYRLVDLGTLGGPNSFQNAPGRSLNDAGVAIGEADTAVADPNAPVCFADCTISPAFVWTDGHLRDLGALPGPNSSCATWITDRGLIAGVSEYAVDPAAGGALEKAVVWAGGRVVDLGTLGGNESDAGAINDSGEVAGAALNLTTDPIPHSSGILAENNCAMIPINTTEVRAVVWRRGRPHDLGTLGGPDAMASWLNDRGEVVGQSFTSSAVNTSTGYPTMDPFLWYRGRMIDLGTLGGTSAVANWLSGSGVIVGTSNLAGDQTHHAFVTAGGHLRDLGTLGGANSEAFFANDGGIVVGRADFDPAGPYHHAFLWCHGHMVDLGSIDGDSNTTAYGINDRDQVVGDGSGDHGWLWQDGSMRDLNTLVAPGSGLSVVAAASINNSGVIYGTADLPNGDQHVVLLVPVSQRAR